MRLYAPGPLAYGFLALILLLSSPPVSADDSSARGPLRRYAQAAPADRLGEGSPATLVPFGAMTKIIVWRSPEAMQDGIALARSNAPAIEVYPLVSCVTDPGSRVVIVDAGDWDRLYIVRVTDGPHAGCGGAVLNVNVRR
ncbi:MAG TPA: hypothetical protein VMI34_10310 [Candidatus Bathyarchaeia archaeon]|nr:hypothetical protein [Candidatus Bathyarchaeia archaeon]